MSNTRTTLGFAALLLMVIVFAGFLVNLVDSPLSQTSTHSNSNNNGNHGTTGTNTTSNNNGTTILAPVNVQLTCSQGFFLANHQCLPVCPTGYAPGSWFVSPSDTNYRYSPCMSSDNRPVSIYDLAGLQVSPDNGTTRYSIVSDTPLAKIFENRTIYQTGWELRVASSVLDTLRTFRMVPVNRTEIASIGDQVSTLKILHIDHTTVSGNQSTFWPVEYCCTKITIHIGDNVGVACEGHSDTLSAIDFKDQKVEFAIHTWSSPPYGCPICLSGDTNIATVTGDVNVKNLSVGMKLWTLDKYGDKVAEPILLLGRTLVPPSHEMVHLVLSDGRQLYASPRHPTVDGRQLGQLRPGDHLGGSIVVSADLVLYNQSYTYDLLPAGDTGYYWANGILIASTLKAIP